MGFYRIIFAKFFLILLSCVLSLHASANNYEKGHEAFLNNRWEEAIVLYTQYLKTNPKTEEAVIAQIELSEAYYKLGTQYFEKGEYEISLELYHSSNLPEGDKMMSECNYKMAEREFEDRNYAKACSLYYKMLTPNVIGMSKCLFEISQLKGYKLSISDIKKWIDELGPQNVMVSIDGFLQQAQKETESANLYEQANQYYSKGKYSKSLEYYRKIYEKYSATQCSQKAMDKAKECKRQIKLAEERKMAEEERKRAKEERERIKGKRKARIREAMWVNEPNFEEIYETISQRLKSGASTRSALGEFRNIKVKWGCKVRYWCLAFSDKPWLFSREEREFYGIPSEGLNRLRFNLFCDAHKGEAVIIEGYLIGVSDEVYTTPLIVEITAIKVY